MPRVIDTAWRGFLQQVIRDDAPPGLVADMKRAFYAGGITIFTALVAGMSDGDEPTLGDMSMMAGLEGELMEYFAQNRSSHKGSA